MEKEKRFCNLTLSNYELLEKQIKQSFNEVYIYASAIISALILASDNKSTGTGNGRYSIYGNHGNIDAFNEELWKFIDERTESCLQMMDDTISVCGEDAEEEFVVGDIRIEMQNDD